MKGKKAISGLIITAVLLVSVAEFSGSTVVYADTMSQTTQSSNADTNLTSSEKTLINNYVRIYNNEYILDLPKNNNLDKSTVDKIQALLADFNKKVADDNIVLISENDNVDTNYSPFISFARTSKKRKRASHRSSKVQIVGYGSNGYCYKDKHGNFHYVVTRTPFQTVMHVMGHGWANAAGSGFGLGLIK